MSNHTGPRPTASGGNNNSKPWLNNPNQAAQAHQRDVYPDYVWITVGSSIGLFILLNVMYILGVRARRRALSKTIGAPLEGEPISSPSRSHASIRNLPRAMSAAFRILAFRWTLPYGMNYVVSLSELAVSGAYFALLASWTWANSRGLQVGFWNQLSASVAFSQIPLLPLLSGKNNLIGYVTGMSYEKMNILHRNVGRTIFILLMCHAFNKVDSFGRAGLKNQKYYAGVIAAVSIGSIFLCSLRPIRTHAFEFFLILHICLICVFIAGCYFHQPDEAITLWLFIGFWVFDRLFRVFHLLAINQGKPKCTDAMVEVISPNAVRLTLPNRAISWKPGQHVFLVLPGVSTVPFEAHPFTIANIPTGENASDLIFYIRSMDGFTRKLDDYAQRNEGKMVTALVDGPYGCPPPVNTFSTVVLIAGGSGVSFTMPLLLSIVSDVRRKKSPVKRVMFIWSLKDSAEVKWAAQTLSDINNTIPEGLSLDIRIHLTRAKGLVSSLDNLPAEKAEQTDSPIKEKADSPISETKFSMEQVIRGEKVGTSGTRVTTAPADEGASSDDHYTHTTEHYKTVFGRPDIPATIHEEIEASSGPVLVTASGPSPLTKAVRASLTSGPAGPLATLRGSQPVIMHIENFGAVRST